MHLCIIEKHNLSYLREIISQSRIDEQFINFVRERFMALLLVAQGSEHNSSLSFDFSENSLVT